MKSSSHVNKFYVWISFLCLCVYRLKQDNATKCEYQKIMATFVIKWSQYSAAHSHIFRCAVRDTGTKKKLLSQSEHCRKTKTLNSRNDTHKNLLASCKYNSHKDNYNTNKNSISSRIVVLRARNATVKLIASIFCEKWIQHFANYRRKWKRSTCIKLVALIFVFINNQLTHTHTHKLMPFKTIQ